MSVARRCSAAAILVGTVLLDDLLPHVLVLLPCAVDFINDTINGQIFDVGKA